MDNLARRYATFAQVTRSGAASVVLARAHTSMPSYAVCGTVQAKPLNVQRSTFNRNRGGTNKPDIRSDSSVEAILGGKRPWKYHIIHDRQMITFYG